MSGWPRWRRVVMFMIVLPMLTSTVVRSFAWVVILGNQGLINRVLICLRGDRGAFAAAVHARCRCRRFDPD